MKTSTWQPSMTQQAGSSHSLGLAQRFVVTGRGEKGMELSSIAALVMTITYMRANIEVSVTTLEGVEVAYSRNGELNGQEEFMQGLFLMDQALISERKMAVRETLEDVAERAGFRFENNELIPVAPAVEQEAEPVRDESDSQQTPQLRNRSRNRRN